MTTVNTLSTLPLTHARFRILETIRIPIAVVGGAFFPAASMLFFVVPFAGDDPAGATFATASMVLFAVMTSSLFTYGVGVAEDRAQPWDPFTRTLPAGPASAFAGRILSGLTFMALSLLPVVIIGWLFTAATASWSGLLLALGAVILGAMPFTFMGLAIGYALPMKAALAVAQIIFFPLAFGGGLLSDPNHAPGFVQTIAPYLPTRGAAELLWAAVGDFDVSTTSMVSFAAWTVAMAALAAWAFRRDEGARFS
jgi:ABC-2 type transport system permease protein